MNTFLPYEDYHETAKVLDNLRLNTTINEALVILRSISRVYPVKERTQLSGFEGHTIAKFWTGYEFELAKYGFALAQEYLQRPISSNNPIESLNKKKVRYQQWKQLIEFMEDQGWEAIKPSLLGDETFHSGFRSFLLYKDIQAETYKKWKKGEYPNHIVTRNLLPKKSSWVRQNYINIWEFFGQPEPNHYGQFGWEEEPDDLKIFYSEDKMPQIKKEIQRKVDKPMVSYLRR